MDNSHKGMLLFCKNMKRIKKHSRKWKQNLCHELCKQHHLMLELKKDPVKFANYFRITHNKFEELLNILHENLSKQTKFRKSVEPEKRLAFFLK